MGSEMCIRDRFVSHVCTGVFAKRTVVPEDVVALSVFTFFYFQCFSHPRYLHKKSSCLILLQFVV